MRLFVAIHLPDNIKNNIARLENSLREFDAQVKWIPVEKIHLTLKFLDEVNENLLDSIFSSLKGTVSLHNIFSFTVGRTGVFPNWNRPHVFWIGCKDNKDSSLLKLQLRIEDCLEPVGFQREKRRFKSHITIGRYKSNRNIKNLCDFFKNISFPQTPCRVNSIHVMRSKLRSSGAEYSTLKTISLKQ